ncbi:MAG TPA: MarC family protein, partial [Usitatibacteraceae bacterium]|nr:MarC family protein [Usitatibacteraceae bacterium]
MEAEFASAARTALVTLAALLPITNPPGNAPIFLALTHGMGESERRAMARRVGLNCLVLLLSAAFFGRHVLAF